MQTSSGSRPTKKIILLVVSAAVLIALITIGAYGLIAGTGSSNNSTPPDETAKSSEILSSRPVSPLNRLKPVTATNNPEEFVSRVATALFTWDTGSGFMPLDYAATLLEVGDPSGHEQAGLAADIATYFPSREAWLQLRRYGTTQQIDIAEISMPLSWKEAVSQAKPGQLVPGVMAYTIDGVRMRGGEWEGKTESLSEPVTFTLFIACPPDGGDCYLLRISQLGNPLR